MLHTENSLKVALYIRVSTEEQVSDGFGIEMQLNALKNEVKHKQQYQNWIHKDEWVYIDKACSGADLKRESYQEMMAAAKRQEFDLVLVWKIDRLSRTLSHLLKVFETLQRYGIGFYSLKENIDFSGAIGKLTFQLFGALAEFERETIKSRTIEGKIASARMGNYIGTGIPYGYRKVPRQNGKGNLLETVPHEVKIVRKIFNDFVFNKKNYEQIAKELNKLGIPKGVSSRKKRNSLIWYSSFIRKIINNQNYIGLNIARMKDSNGQVQELRISVPSIVSELLFRQAQHIVDDISKTKSGRGGGKHTYLLSRKIVDVETGRNFVGVPRTKGGHSYRRKNFIEKDSGITYPNMELPAKPLEDFVWEHVSLIINDPAKFYEIYKRQNISDKRLDDLKVNEKLLRENIDFQAVKITNIHNDFYDGNISSDIRDQLVEKCEQAATANKEKLGKISQEISGILKIKSAEQSIHEFAEQFAGQIEDLKPKDRQIIVDILVEKNEVIKTESEFDIRVLFKFAPPSKSIETTVVEPGNRKDKRANDTLAADNCVSGNQPWKGDILDETIFVLLEAMVVKYRMGTIWNTEIRLKC